MIQNVKRKLIYKFIYLVAYILFYFYFIKANLYTGIYASYRSFIFVKEILEINRPIIILLLFVIILY